MAPPTTSACRGILIVFFAATFFLCSAPHAQPQRYPAKPIRLIVPFAPGGGNDLIARMIAQRLNAMWGQAVIVDNRSGAGGNVAAETTARAAPDGYTAFQFNIANTIAPSIYRALRYDPVTDFAPVTQIATSPFILIAHPGVPAKSVPELIAMAHQAPGKWSYGSSGNGGSTHLAMELLKSMTRTDFVHVPYGGGNQALNDVISGQIQLLFTVPVTALPQMQAGRVRGLAVSGTRRLAVAPELPTIDEAGARGYESSAWYGLVLPARTAPVIVNALHDAVVRLINEPDFSQKLTSNAMQVVGSAPEDFAAFIRAEVAKWARVVKIANAVVN